MASSVKSEGGSYALIFHCPNSLAVNVGRLGQVLLVPGYYVYCGSAFGPGGVRSRTDHHRKISQRPHWHIDYLRPHLQLLEIWFSFDQKAREHQWAEQISQLRGAELPFPGFGSSDCRCLSHLIRIGFKPSFRSFRQRVRSADPAHGRFHCLAIVQEGDGLKDRPE